MQTVLVPGEKDKAEIRRCLKTRRILRVCPETGKSEPHRTLLGAVLSRSDPFLEEKKHER